MSGLSERAQAVYDRTVKGKRLNPSDDDLCRAYCTLVARLEDARERIDRDGAIVADERGRPVKHPALDIERAAAADLMKLQPMIRRVTA